MMKNNYNIPSGMMYYNYSLDSLLKVKLNETDLLHIQNAQVYYVKFKNCCCVICNLQRDELIIHGTCRIFIDGFELLAYSRNSPNKLFPSNLVLEEIFKEFK